MARLRSEPYRREEQLRTEPGPAEANSRDAEYDVVVFGSGAGGMTAALAAALEGLTVVVCEKHACFGGTASNSGGGIWVPCSSQAMDAGIEDSPEIVRRYLRGELGRAYNEELVEAFLQSGPRALDDLASRSELKLQLGDIPDYHPEAPGGRLSGRVLFPEPFDGRKLGKAFSGLRSPWRRFLIFGGMMVGRREIPALMRPFSSWANFRYVCRVLARYASDRLKYPRGTNLLMGNALAGRLLYSLRKAGVAMQSQATLVDLLLTPAGGVQGALVDTPSGRLRLRARKGVVLATGGFPHSATLRARYAADYPHHHSMAYRESVGDGLKAAVRIGAGVVHDEGTPCFWTPVSVLQEKDGSQLTYGYGHLDRGKPGAILVNARGRRFANESDSYHDVILAMFSQGDADANVQSHLVCDHDFIRKWGCGAVRPAPYRLQPFIERGYLIRAGTLEALADRIGVDRAALLATVGEHNQHARAGVDPVFGKGSSAFNRYNGDTDCKPNPCLKVIEHGPFYAVRIYPGTIGTAAGIRTDGNAQVLREDGSKIAGLYACGNDMASVMRGHYPGPGITLGPAIVFGWRAGMHIAGRLPMLAMPSTADEAGRAAAQA